MFSALDDHGVPCVLYRRSTKEIEHLKKGGPFYCPMCEEAVQLRLSTKRAPHFAHLPRSSCSYKGESLRHQKGKLMLFEWLHRQKLKPKLEHFLPAIGQRPDVYVEWKTYKFALEFQCSVISPAEVKRRTRHYQKAGIVPLWIISEDKVKGKPPLLSFSEFLRNFIYCFDNHLHFYTFSPESKRFSILDIHQSLSSRKILVRPRSTFLPSLSFPDLFRAREASIQWEWWERSVYRYRTTPILRPSGKDRQFLQFLYLNRIHYSLIPSVCFLPLRYQPLYDKPAHLWQTRAIVSHFLPLKKGEILRMPSIPVRDILGKKTIDLMDEYLEELAYLGYAVKKGECWYKQSDIPFSQNIEQALRQDKELMIQLKHRDDKP
ncbi:competence protein CoiA [Salimicrobium halophilum]|uniref:Competence protein CoiA-like family, contains a predicted nuclease domain n=1 Tax=Salimicrobium halophilum TaxID=86666 RepID=A0A1G8TU25_9BACI|nr:competence protein CoiA family protein [Salimicrobium halophilum]SDJ44884.1 Competence protein CoiA-like family, contains a predicted nuclease domain [Salimicrobium halophilum]